ncbi:hypothetical protein BDF14DRAFT_1794962 [Spinellus fusiger]|nr:hypothetical protein BDF14DRAFT_1794962 [Spinellus fusiger]
MANVSVLDKSVIYQLRSSVVMTTLQQCLIELIHNALDANATTIEAGIDMNSYIVQVSDNGTGILPESISHIAKQHMTSKCHTLSDLHTLKTFGFRGEAFAALAEASILQITSRHYQHDTTWMTLWKDSTLIECSQAKKQYRKAGTQVIARNIFYKHPVRQKQHMLESQFAAEYRLELIKRAVSAIALVFPNVSFHLLNLARDTSLLNVKRCSSSIGTFQQLYGRLLAQALDPYQTQDNNSNKVHGYISRKGFPSKVHQYIYINQHRIKSKYLYKTIVDIISKHLLFYNTSQSEEYSNNKKGEKYPIFLIQIECPSLGTHDVSLYDDTMDGYKLHKQIDELVCNFVYGFLQSRDLMRPHVHQKMSLNKKNKGTENDKPLNSVYQQHTPCGVLGNPISSVGDVPMADPPSLSTPTSCPVIPSQLIPWKDPHSNVIVYIDKRTGNSYHAPFNSSSISPSNDNNTVNSVNRSFLRTQPLTSTPITPAYNTSLDTHWIDYNEQHSYKLSKEDLQSVTVLGQVDSKFILLSLQHSSLSLFLVDQHAADERIKLERMLHSLEEAIDPLHLDPPILIDIHLILCDLVVRYQSFLNRWGIHHTLVQPKSLLSLRIQSPRLKSMSTNYHVLLLIDAVHLLIYYLNL